MPINLNHPGAEVRERRLDSITEYMGTLQDLHEQARDGCIRGQGKCFSQASSCMNIEALSISLGRIKDIAIINHGPSGCVANAPGTYLFNEQKAPAGTVNHTVYLGTDMKEEDTVFGAIDSLREIVRETYRRYQPKAIFVAATCASAIIGEDIDTLVEEMKAELQIPMAVVHCEGFRSRVWASGFDAADHAVLTSGMIREPQTKRRVINFKDFRQTEKPLITEILRELEAEPQFLYCNASVEELSHLAEALATVSICDTLGTYLGNALEEKYGVPYLRTISPMGIAGFETWLRELGKVTGKTEQAEAYIARQRERYLPEIDAVKEKLQGLKAVIGMGPGFTFEITRTLQELGIEIIHAIAWHFDSRYDDGQEPESLRYLAETSPNNFRLTVAEQQNHQLTHILNEYQPDIYLARHPGSTVWAVKQGIPALFFHDEYMMFGYDRMLKTAKTILDMATNRNFVQNLAARTSSPYTGWWYRQNRSILLKET